MAIPNNDPALQDLLLDHGDNDLAAGRTDIQRKPWQRWLFLGIVTLLIAALAAMTIAKKGRANDEENINHLQVELIIPNLCALNTLVEQKDLAEASRYFWDRIHFSSHLIVSLLLNADQRAEAMEINRAKASVEADMRILSPNLAASVPKLLAAARSGVQTLDLQGSDNACLGVPPTDFP